MTERARNVLAAAVLALCAALLALLLGGCATADAALMELTVTGELQDGENFDFFGLTPPTPFVFKMRYEDAAEDENPDPTLGEYETAPSISTLDFGPWHFETDTAEVRVYSGHMRQPGDIPVWGFTAGPADAFSQHGLAFDDYNSFYLSLLEADTAAVSPDDSLHWFCDSQGASALMTASYFKINGTDETTGEFVRYQANSELHFTVEEVPEAEPTMLTAIALLGFLGLTRQRV